MKKILLSSSLVTAALAIGFVFQPDRAIARTTAHEKYVTMRTALAKAFSDGELTISGSQTGDSTTFTVTLDGSPLPPDIPVHVNADKHEGYTDYTIQVDFSDSNFSTIAFGKEANTLRLVPKGSSDHYDIVKLDPATGKPLKWSAFKNGSTKATTSISYKSQVLKGNPVPPKGNSISYSSSDGYVPTESVVTAHMRIATK